jgi:hypothetical protein
MHQPITLSELGITSVCERESSSSLQATSHFSNTLFVLLLCPTHPPTGARALAPAPSPPSMQLQWQQELRLHLVLLQVAML